MSSETPAAVKGAEAVFGDAWTVIQAMAKDPIGAQASECARLGPARALNVGGLLAIIAAIASTIGTISGVSAAFGAFGGFGRGGNSASAFFQVLFTTLIFLVVAAGVAFLVRRLQNSNAAFAPDLFTVGTAALPMGVAVLLAGVIGAWQLGALLSVAGLVYFILLLYTGLTSLAGLTVRVAPLVVAAMLVIGTLITQALM
ncbi:MAG: hypothetical protein EPO35_01665 [Acidobacteria bacterium]|nr:MAG: hypothetical protein EPO35_01665 [Acidobacteriota bacterium]